MPKVTSKSRAKPVDFFGRKKEDSQKEKPLKTESDDLKIPVDTNDLDDLVKFDSMGFQNPYASMYSQVLVKNIEEKELALRNFQIDELKDEIKHSIELEEVQKAKGKSVRTSGEARSPYSIRERKKNINYGEIDLETGKQKVKNTTVPLRRLSQRLLNKPAVALNESSLTNESLKEDEADSKMFKRGPLKMEEVVMETVDEEKWLEDMKMLGNYLAKGREGMEETQPMEKSWKMEIERYKTAKRYWSYPKNNADNLDKFKAKVSKLRMWCGSMGRVIKERAASLAVHPSKDCLLISAGGKNGALGLWVVFPEFGGDKEVVKKETVVDYPTGIYRFEPHDGLINCASFCRFGGDRLITNSYDGTVRVLNLEKLVFDQLYGSPDDMRNDWMQWHCQLSPNVILASQGTGNVYVLDDRSDREYEAVLKCYHLSCRTVDIHPLHPQYLATSSSCGYTSIWDLRKFKKDSKNSSESEIKGIANSDAAVCHLGDNKRRLFSAFFSPVTGNGLLTTSSDDYIRLYDTAKLAQAASSSTYRVETSIRHDNRTGRWITPFRAAWHPQRDDAFVIGSMGQPRKVEIYGRHGRLLTTIGNDGPLPINTICSVNAFHPHRLVLASADSAGRVHVFL